MHITEIEFHVLGRPIPQGSKTVAYTKDRSKIWLRDVDIRLGDWREKVAQAAWQRLGGQQINDAVEVKAIFYFQRPKVQLRANGDIRDDAPGYCTKRIDVDKLQRAIGDSLSDSILADDSLIVRWSAQKEWADTHSEGVHIMIRRLT